jgi:ubiquitin conjugation factor E4 B
MKILCENTKVVEALTSSDAFLVADCPAWQIENLTLLGPLFKTSPLQQKYYSSAYVQALMSERPPKRDVVPGAIRNIQVSQNLAHSGHQQDLLDIVNRIIRSSAQSRERMLSWFADVLNKNVKREGIQWDARLVSTDGFMHNVATILDRLCEPFMDNTFGKVDRIDINYFRRKPKLDISQTTKINADQKQSDEFYSKPVEGTNNFITEIFFLSLAGQQYGTQSLVNKVKQLDKTLESLEKHIAQMEGERQNFVNVSQCPNVAYKFCLLTFGEDS